MSFTSWQFAALLIGVFALYWRLPWRVPEQRQRKAFLLLSLGSNLVVLGFFKYFNFFASSLVHALGALGWKTGWTLPRILLPVGISFYTFQAMSYTIDVYRGDTKPV